MPHVPRGAVTSMSGFMMAGDVPPELVESALTGAVEPIRVVLLDKKRDRLVEVPCRPITEEEAVMLINRMLQEGKIAFGFQKRGGPTGGVSV